MTSEIEPATFWLVAQCLNQQRYHFTYETSLKSVDYSFNACDYNEKERGRGREKGTSAG
jgi:hypothetical protein